MAAASGEVVLIVTSVIFLLIQNQIVPCEGGEYILQKVEIPDKDLRIFTNEDLKKYDDSDPDKPIFMAIKGVVFDVSKGKSFYGKDAPYNVLVGRDCTRAVAKMSLEPEDLTHDITGLSDDALESLDRTFSGTYEAKYPVVGYMDYLVMQKTNFPSGNRKKDFKDDL